VRNPADLHHQRCVAALRQIEPPLITTWAVLTEAAWLLRQDTEVVGRMLRGSAEGLFEVARLAGDELPALDALRRRYADLSPQLADLTLLHLAQRENYDTVFTLDRRDFTVFRIKGKKRLRLIPDS
jgi:predicted nucleic acid-binding protein